MFLLQPVVENSVLHGFRASGGSGTVRVTCRLDGERLEITVADNGCGIPGDRLRELNDAARGEGAPPEPGARIGVRNVAEQIRVRYGAPFGLRFESGESGTSAVYTLPVIREEDDDENSDDR